MERLGRVGSLDLVCWIIVFAESERVEILDSRTQYTLITMANIARDRTATSFDPMTRATPPDKSRTIADIKRPMFPLLRSFRGTFIFAIGCDKYLKAQ
jgi:hypothetical protein